jgi:CBS domain-containing protein
VVRAKARVVEQVGQPLIAPGPIAGRWVRPGLRLARSRSIRRSNAMGQQIKNVMTKTIFSVGEDTTLRQVAEQMRDHQIGDVLVTDDAGRLCGIVTDRDVVVRAVAEGMDLDVTKASEICSEQLVTLEPDAEVEDAVKLMRDRAIRRIPVVSDDKPVGIVTIGDLALARDPDSALADISAAPANT